MSTITIRSNDNVLAQIDALAERLDRSRNYLINEALEAYLERHAWQIAEIEAGLAELDGGDSLSHEELKAEMSTVIKAKTG